jgi:hypothetical protein
MHFMRSGQSHAAHGTEQDQFHCLPVPFCETLFGRVDSHRLATAFRANTIPSIFKLLANLALEANIKPPLDKRAAKVAQRCVCLKSNHY